ncbi:MAG: hypothetical protein OQK12_05770 [Motiliproteus sp.]|nr:hypothetical protein [Motiliproteus sp.]MCW9053503.1 hypothetical protein [Motiliproteus sp.]
MNNQTTCVRTAEDLNQLVTLLINLLGISEGNEVALLLNDSISVSNFEAVKRWVAKVIWQRSSAQEDVYLNELANELLNTLEKARFDAQPLNTF